MVHVPPAAMYTQIELEFALCLQVEGKGGQLRGVINEQAVLKGC
jgi:hypothetical protein